MNVLSFYKFAALFNHNNSKNKHILTSTVQKFIGINKDQ